MKVFQVSCFLTSFSREVPSLTASDEHNTAAARDLVAKYSASSGGR